MTMRKNTLIYLAFLLLPGLISCTDNDDNNPDIAAGDGQVHLQATVKENNVLTRALVSPEDGNYYLYCTKVGETELSSNKFNLSGNGTTWTASPTLYWDDIKKETTNTFYLTNMDDMTFPTDPEDRIVNKDILFGKATGWNTPLNFTLTHLTSKITVIVYDNTLNKDKEEGKVNFGNAKVVFYPGLNRTTTGIDYTFTDGDIIGKIKSEDTDKDKTTAINRANFTDKDPVITIGTGLEAKNYNGVESSPLYIVPHAFYEEDYLEVTAGKYVYRIPVPIPSGATYPFNLKAGEHLTIQVELSEDVITATAKLIGWEEKVISNPIEISRVFNIASWNELRDLAQAVATGYTFKGMVVRLTEDIELQDQISLGTEEYPFEGVFSGNGCSIKNLGIQGEGMRRNKGGLFAYTKGATVQDLILVAPYVEPNGDNPVGALIDNATNTTVFNCKTTSNAAYEAGDVNGGTTDKVGGLIGTATGTSTVINCYSRVRVEGTGEFIGGLIGYSEASITHCFAKGEVDGTGNATHVGGLVGHMEGSMNYCYAQGDVTGSTKVGGLIGHLDGKISQCYSSGRVTGTEAGGLVNCLGFDAVVEKCFWINYGGNTPGSGSATLPDNCRGYADGADFLDTEQDYYLDNSTSIWTLVGNYPEFTNQ